MNDEAEKRTFDLEFDLTAGDLQALEAYASKHLQSRRRERLGGQFRVALILLFVFCGVAMHKFDIALAMWPVWLAVVVYLAAGSEFRRWLNRRHVVRRLADPAALDGLKGRRLTVTPEGVRHVSKVQTLEIKWPGIERLGATKEHAFLFFEETTAIVVPKRAFATGDEFREFVETARQYREAAGS